MNDYSIELNKYDRMWLGTSCATMICSKEDTKIKIEWREKIRNSVLGPTKIIIYDISEFGCAFPNITTLRRVNKIKTAGDVDKYFRHLGDINKEINVEGNLSHNVLVYRKIFEVPFNEEILTNEEICAVKVVDMQNSSFIGFGGTYQNVSFDLNYFGGKIQDSRYYLTHGHSNKGLVIIEAIEENEYNKYKLWFENVQKDANNPFVKNKNKLENRLKTMFN